MAEISTEEYSMIDRQIASILKRLDVTQALAVLAANTAKVAVTASRHPQGLTVDEYLDLFASAVEAGLGAIQAVDDYTANPPGPTEIN